MNIPISNFVDGKKLRCWERSSATTKKERWLGKTEQSDKWGFCSSLA
jgi:hypothetical protein